MSLNYLKPGLIILSLFVMIGCRKETPSPVLKSGFTVDKTVIWTGDTVTFTNTSQEAFYYYWVFGDGSTSTAENPSHIFNISGGYKVILRAVGSFTADTSYVYITVKPLHGEPIHDGKGIKELNLGYTWDTVRNLLPPIDTVYTSSFLPQYNLYRNEVYYTKLGILADFLSGTLRLNPSDTLYLIGVVSPYQGLTSKEITIGSRLTHVVASYGNPENIYNSQNYTGLLYNSLGIEFYSYNYQDTALVAEIDVFDPNAQGARKSVRLTARGHY